MTHDPGTPSPGTPDAAPGSGGQPMCDRWYARSGGLQAWQVTAAEQADCQCEARLGTPSAEHGEGCPVGQSYESGDWLAQVFRDAKREYEALPMNARPVVVRRRCEQDPP